MEGALDGNVLGWLGSAGPAGGTTICAGRGPGHGMRPPRPASDRDRRSLARSQSKPDSSEYLQRVKFQSKSRDNTTASLGEGKNLNLPKLKAALTVPAGDRRRSPVQRRPGGQGRPSGKT